MKIAVLAPVLSARDAVGTDVLDMAMALRGAGHDVRVCAEHADGVAETVHTPAMLSTWLREPHDVLIYHCSIGWPRAQELLARLRCRIFVRYHNITPPEFFYGLSRDHVRACAAGRATLPALMACQVEHWIACSRFNADELIALGADAARVAVLPPFNRIEALRDTAPDLDLLDRYRDGPCTWLNVGRLAPNKDHAALLDAFACFLRQVDANARLLIVGKHDPRLRRYTRQVHARIAALGIAAQVHLLDDVSEATLKACYLVADALVVTSQHEGFCVPLAEAMALSVPIVARASSAVGETIGDAGLAWDDDDVRLLAASVARLQRDGAAKAQFTAAGRARYRARFDHAVLTGQLLQFLQGVT